MHRSILFGGVLFLAAAPLGLSQTFGAGEAGALTDQSGFYAVTVNDSGNLLGMYCFPETDTCIWLVGMVTRCDEDHVYPILANCDTGSLHLELTCGEALENGLYSYVFNSFDSINDLVLKSYKLGLAIPLEGDQFRVIRFDLQGSNEAIVAASTAAAASRRQAPAKPAPRQGTRDQLM